MRAKSLVSGQTYFSLIALRTPSTGFFDDGCREFYLRRLLNCQNAYQVRLHAYLLLEDRIFLLLTPLTPTGFSSYCRFLNRSYGEYYRIRFARSIAVWQNQPIVLPLPTDKLILDCQKFIERYALSIGSALHPGEYHYSSYCSNAFVLRPKFLQRQQAVRRFIGEETSGLGRYREFVDTPFRREYEQFLRNRLLWGRPLVSRKPSTRLERNGPLTAIKKNGTILVSE